MEQATVNLATVKDFIYFIYLLQTVCKTNDTAIFKYNTLACGWNKIISNDQVMISAKNIKAKFIGCYFWVTRVVSFGVVLYRYQ